jgi:hypothetical protein
LGVSSHYYLDFIPISSVHHDALEAPKVTDEYAASVLDAPRDIIRIISATSFEGERIP